MQASYSSLTTLSQNSCLKSDASLQSMLIMILQQLEQTTTTQIMSNTRIA